MTTRRDGMRAIAVGMAWPPAAWAQSRKVYRIGVLEITSAAANLANLDAFLQGLREAGYVEGQNIIIDYRSADGRPERFAELAADLIRAKPDIILTRGTPAALAAKSAGSIPVVMTTSADPVGARVVASLARPGGNVTGLTTINSELAAKRVEILKDLIPGITRIAAFFNMGNPTSAGEWGQFDRTARALGLQALQFDIRDAEALRGAFKAAASQRVGAIVVNSEAVMTANRSSIIDLAARHKLPAMYSDREFVNVGGLMSYGALYPHQYYRAASYVDKILKGAKPGDLPIEQPTKLHLVVNQKTAKKLGLALSRDFLARVDEVID